MMNTTVREFDGRDAEAVSRLIRENLMFVNSRDYVASVIDYMCALFTPAYFQDVIVTRVVLVAEENGKIVGTVSLDEDEICGLYVDISAHGRRVGERLLCRIEEVALSRNIHLVHLSASLTAVGFYEKMGYHSNGLEESELFGPAYTMTKLL